MLDKNICIIGFGSRGLSIFERIAGFAREGLLQQFHLNVYLIDRGEPGVGIHSRTQPDYLSLNTICGQLTTFTDESVLEAGPINLGPTLYEWAIREEYRLANDGFTLLKAGREIQPNDFLPRKLLGTYLQWSFEFMKRNLTENITLHLHAQNAIRYEQDRNGKAIITLEDETHLLADYVFITVGHTLNLQKNSSPVKASTSTNGQDIMPFGYKMPKLIDDPYPLVDKLKDIKPGERLGISGLGLSALDCVAELTLGRGGRFTTDTKSAHQRYVPSGKEPVIFLYSRSGLPYRARPVISDIDKSYHALLFTDSMIDQLRSQKRQLCGSPQLDFRQDVLPLLFHEMRLVYYQRLEQIASHPSGSQNLRQAFVDAYNQGTLQQLIDSLAERYGPAELPNHVFCTRAERWQDGDQYQDWVSGFIRADLYEALAGRCGSPLKDALDLFRDLRGVIRYIVDYSGLTPSSHQEFVRTFISLMNRIVGGPSIEQCTQLLALVEAGIVRIPFGPSPNVRFNQATGKYDISSSTLETPYSAEVDWLCTAHVKQSTVERSASPLIQSLYKGNYIQPYYNGTTYIGGVSLNRNLQPLNAQGGSVRNLWILGPLSEGVKFYNHYVASPLKRSQSQLDAGFCVKQMIEDMKKKHSSQVS